MRDNESRRQRAVGQGWLRSGYVDRLQALQLQRAQIFLPIGFSEKIPGYPRYSMIGDRNYGVYNLRIQNASLEDDAEFQCQVGPAKNSDPIRTAANLTVICEYRWPVHKHHQIAQTNNIVVNAAWRRRFMPTESFVNITS